MAIIDYLDGVDPINGSRRAITFTTSPAGPIAKRRTAPNNPHTNPRNNVRSLLYRTNIFYWALNDGQKNAWANLAAAEGITGPYGKPGHLAGYAMFSKLQLNNQLAGHALYANHPPHNPIIPPTWLTLTRIDNTTIRVTFNPSANWNLKQIYLRQALPGPGINRWDPTDGYVAQYSPLNPNSPYDFTTHFPHLAGWNGRYWLGCQRSCGCRSAEELWDI